MSMASYKYSNYQALSSDSDLGTLNASKAESCRDDNLAEPCLGS